MLTFKTWAKESEVYKNIRNYLNINFFCVTNFLTWGTFANVIFFFQLKNGNGMKWNKQEKESNFKEPFSETSKFINIYRCHIFFTCLFTYSLTCTLKSIWSSPFQLAHCLLIFHLPHIFNLMAVYNKDIFYHNHALSCKVISISLNGIVTFGKFSLDIYHLLFNEWNCVLKRES